MKAHRAAVTQLQNELVKLRHQKYYSASLPARSKIAQLVLPFSEAIVARANKYTGRTTGPAPTINYQADFKALLEQVEPEVISLIFLKSVFDALGAFDKMTTAKVASFVGGRLEDEARFRYYQSLGNERLAAAANKRVNVSNSNPHYRRMSTKLISEKIAADEGLAVWEPWSSLKKCGLGIYLIEVLKEAGMVTLEMASVKAGKTPKFLVFTPEFLEQQRHTFEEVKSISFKEWPLLVPPLPWVVSADQQARHNFSGGFHSDLCRHQLPMCRGYHYRSVFSSATAEFLNVLGRTAWCIDRGIYEVAKACFDSGVSVGSLKAVFRPHVLDQGMPAHIAALPTDHQDRREWRKSQAVLWEEHNDQKRRSVRTRQALNLAGEYINHPRFYLSWSADYRTRVYTQQPFLHYQATQFEKALIRFADGCRLDEGALKWVEMAIGASYIGTKGSFDERRSWCKENQQLIAAVAADPLGTITHWEAAEEPWLFLQMALEYRNVVLTREKPFWDIPLQIDATSSGLQILSGSLLDPIGCQFSNVTCTGMDRPQDAYLEVVRRAREIAEATTKWQRYVPYLNSRSLGKASLLVALYGGSHGTRNKRVMETLVDANLYPDTLDWKDSNAITSIIQEASKETFPKAFAALKWIRALGKLALKNGSTEFVWSTPTSDRIALREFEIATHDIRTAHLGRVTSATERSPKLAATQMINALAPSWVHSLDATILKTALADWKHPVASIHDCLALLPSDLTRMMDRLHKAFVFTVSNDPLRRLADDLGVSEEQLPRLELGTADLSRISPFMFN